MFVGLNFLAKINGFSQVDNKPVGEVFPGNDSAAFSNPLLSDTVRLGEAKIRPFKDYASFKQAFITFEPGSGQIDSLANIQELIKNQLDMGITPEMDAQSRFTNSYVRNLNQPQGLVILSNKPGKGLPVIPLIRKLTGKEKKMNKNK